MGNEDTRVRPSGPPSLLVPIPPHQNPERASFQKQPCSELLLPFYHLKTIYLFTKSDIKTVVLPQALFATSSLLTNGFRDVGTLPPLTVTSFLQPLLLAIAWVYTSLLLGNISNQRLPGSITEDAFNKPWRPLPSRRITPDKARHVALYLAPSLMLFGAASNTFRETTSLIIFLWMYNDLDGANASIWWRNLLNATGLMTFSAGTAAITSGWVEYSFVPKTAFLWILVTGLVVGTTIHAQDLPDVVGDAARGRKTIPLVYGDMTARVSLAVGVMFWSFVVPAFWGLGWAWYGPPVVLGSAMAFGTFWRRTLDDDAIVLSLWCFWCAVIYLLPCCRMLSDVFG